MCWERHEARAEDLRAAAEQRRIWRLKAEDEQPVAEREPEPKPRPVEEKELVRV